MIVGRDRTGQVGLLVLVRLVGICLRPAPSMQTCTCTLARTLSIITSDSWTLKLTSSCVLVCVRVRGSCLGSTWGSRRCDWCHQGPASGSQSSRTKGSQAWQCPSCKASKWATRHSKSPSPSRDRALCAAMRRGGGGGGERGESCAAPRPGLDRGGGEAVSGLRKGREVGWRGASGGAS